MRQLRLRYRASVENGKFDWLRDVLTKETPRLGLWLGTSHQTPEESADTIIAKLDESLIFTDPMDGITSFIGFTG